MRSALAGASALVVIALVLGSDLKAGRPIGRDLQRDCQVERAVVRQFTASLARAVRDLVGGQKEKSAIHAHFGVDLGVVEVTGAAIGAWASGRPHAAMLRCSLLDLPPPTCA